MKFYLSLLILCLLHTAGAQAQKIASRTIEAEGISVQLPVFQGVEPQFDQGPLFVYGTTDFQFIYNVFRDLKSEIAASGSSTDLDTLYHKMVQSIRDMYVDAQSSGKTSEVIHGMPARYELMTVVVDEKRFCFYVAMYETSTVVYSVAITFDADILDKYREALDLAIHSFREH